MKHYKIMFDRVYTTNWPTFWKIWLMTDEWWCGQTPFSLSDLYWLLKRKRGDAGESFSIMMIPSSRLANGFKSSPNTSAIDDETLFWKLASTRADSDVSLIDVCSMLKAGRYYEGLEMWRASEGFSEVLLRSARLLVHVVSPFAG